MSRRQGDTTPTRTQSGSWIASPRPVTELAVGTKLGRYVIGQRLGMGGMGVVYAARDTDLDRDIALKIVRPREDIALMEARLHREAKAMARLSHPNVVPIFDIGTHQGHLFIAMELVAGDTLRSWVDHPHPWRSVALLFAKAGRGLEAAHAAGLLHRDFKPDNVMVGRDNEARITDFGLACELEPDDLPPDALATPRPASLPRVTVASKLAGTPPYMAPEQLLEHQSSAKADQFSFCVSLFEVLHGTRPFHPAGTSLDALIDEIRAGRIVRSAVPRGIPSWLHAVIVRGLAFDPAARWPSMQDLVRALERGCRARRHRLGGLAAVLVIALAVGLGRGASEAPIRCLDLAAKGNDAATILVCRDEYARTSAPEVGTKLADALRRTGNLRDAAAVAKELLATPARADAMYTLGKVAADEDRRDDAERALRLASELHHNQQQWADAAADLLALAGVSNDFVDQLVSIDRAMIDAQRGADAKVEAYCHLGAARLLSEIGARMGATAELARADPLMTSPGDRVWLDFERGNVHQNLGEHAPAIIAFDRAKAGAEQVTIAGGALSAHLNLVYSLAESGRTEDASRELKAADLLDPGNRKLAIRLALEARIAARSGDLAKAAELVERAVTTTPSKATEDLLDLDVQRAEIALEQGDLAVAEQRSRGAIARIEALRSSHPPVELRSWMLTDRRIPYEILLATLARRGDAAGALVAFDRYRGLSVLAGLAHGDGGAPPEGAVAFPTADLARLLPALQRSAFATPPPAHATLDATRTASLLVLVIARDELWRITADAGRLQVTRIDALAALRPLLDRFRVAPRDRVLAATLGDRLVPAELARPSDQVLHVVLDEPLGWLPVAALRVGDRRLISARPIVQPARVSDLGCAALPRGPRHVVTIDTGGAPEQRASTARRDMTRAALLGAARGDLLHVAAPLETDELGDSVTLRDGRVRSLEIAGHGGTAAQVVLAARDAGPAGSRALAMAFLAAGADQVIATVRPVSNAALDQVANRLHDSNITDLARALARIQVTDPVDDNWLGFAVFGRAGCNPSP